MLSFTLLIKFTASSIFLLGCLSRYWFISVSERKAKISFWSSINSCLRVSLSVVKIGKDVKFLFFILSFLLCLVGSMSQPDPLTCSALRRLGIWNNAASLFALQSINDLMSKDSASAQLLQSACCLQVIY